MFSGAVQKVTDAIRGKTTGSSIPGFLRPIDTGRIARDLHLIEVANERGAAELPPTNASAPDAIEQQIIQTVESEWSWQGGELINNLRAYAQRLIGYSVQSEFTNLQIAAKDTLAKLRTADHRAEAELGPLKAEYVGHRDALSEFRERHRLKRIARVPGRRWTSFGLLFLLVAFESLLNGVFFAKGSEFGLAGGIGIAIGISIFNVLFSFALGLWPARWINIRYWSLRIPAALITLAGIAGIILLHAFAAHYRDAVASVGEPKALGEAIRTLLSSPAILADINSYYLFGLGLLFSFSAFYKGYLMDDPYPFYGKMYRAAADAREDYSDVHADLFDDLEETKDGTIKLLSDGITRIPHFPQQAANIRAQRSALVQSFRGYETSVVTAVNQLLAAYRDENRRSRTAEVPRYFDGLWSLPHSFLNSAEVTVLLADSDGPPVDIDAALAELRGLSHEVIDEYERLLSAYPHPTKMEAS